MKSKSYKDLIVWQKACEVAIIVYEITENFPRQELFGLASQMQRASVSVASNIAEGSKRGTKKDFINFLRIAQGSLAELETQISILKKISFGKSIPVENIVQSIDGTNRLLSALIISLSKN